MSLQYSDSPFIVFSGVWRSLRGVYQPHRQADFDGTITTEDSNDHLTDNLGFVRHVWQSFQRGRLVAQGKERRRELNIDILHNRIAFRDAFKEMLESVNEKYTFKEGVDRARKNIKLDPGFKDFFEWSKSANVPVVIVSSGMQDMNRGRPLIRAILENLLGEEDAKKLEIVSNDVEVLDDGHFKIKFKHPESHYGHDKSKALRPYREIKGKRPTIFFCGDGVSDMSAAGESDVLFVKVVEGAGNDLAAHCDREKIPYLPFTSFTQVRDKVRDVVEGRITVEDINSGADLLPLDGHAIDARTGKVHIDVAEKAKGTARA